MKSILGEYIQMNCMVDKKKKYEKGVKYENSSRNIKVSQQSNI